MRKKLLLVISGLLILLTQLFLACGTPTTVPNHNATNTVINNVTVKSTPTSNTDASLPSASGSGLAGISVEATPTPNTDATFWTSSDDYIVTDSLDKLVAKTPIIAVVTIVSEGPIVNLARNSQDPSQPDPNLFLIGQVYQVKVEQYLRGQDAATLNVIQEEGFVPNDIPKTQENIDNGKVFSEIPPLLAGSRFLMFLAPEPSFVAQHYFGGSAEPWLFALTNLGNAQVQTPASQAIQYFPTMPTTNFLNEVKQLISIYPYKPIPNSNPVKAPEPTSTPWTKN